MAKIEKLTLEQQKELINFRADWLKTGLSTEAIDKEGSEKVISNFYQRIGKEKPVFWYFDSPLACQLIINLLFDEKKTANLGTNLGTNLRDNFWTNLRNNLGDSLWANLRGNLRNNLWANLGVNLRNNIWANLKDNLKDSLGANLGVNLMNKNLGTNLGTNLWANLRDNLWTNLRNNLGDSLWANVKANVWANVRGNLWTNLRNNLGDNIWANLRGNLRNNLWANLGVNLMNKNLGANLKYHNETSWGQLEAPWIAFYLFGEKIGVQYKDEDSMLLHLWADLAKSCFWWWAFDGICFISRRPTLIKKNAQGGLHADGQMAVEFSDGWGVYANNGTRLPEHIGKVKVTDWKPEWVLEETNAELRRCLLQNIPSEKLLSVLKCKTIDTWDSGTSVYELVEIENNPYPSRYRALRFTCPTTGKPYLERTHPDETSAKNANLVANHGIDTNSFGWEC